MLVDLTGDMKSDGMRWERSMALMNGIMQCLVWLRDEGQIELTVAKVRDSLSLKTLMAFASRDGYSSLPDEVRASVRAYLVSLPGYAAGKRVVEQSTATLDIHGHAEMQFTMLLGSLTDVYENGKGHGLR